MNIHPTSKKRDLRRPRRLHLPSFTVTHGCGNEEPLRRSGASGIALARAWHSCRKASGSICGMILGQTTHPPMHRRHSDCDCAHRSLPLPPSACGVAHTPSWQSATVTVNSDRASIIPSITQPQSQAPPYEHHPVSTTRARAPPAQRRVPCEACQNPRAILVPVCRNPHAEARAIPACRNPRAETRAIILLSPCYHFAITLLSLLQLSLFDLSLHSYHF